MSRMFEKAAIIGTGLIGGSLGGIMRRDGLAGRVVGIGRSKDNLNKAIERGLVDEAQTDAKKGVAGADIVVLCCPVGMFEAVAREIKPYLKDQAIVTDVGSVKGELAYRLEEIFHLKARYVPAHPIAGSERSGAVASDLDLFKGAKCIVTPTSKTDRNALGLVTDLWESTGAIVERMTPEEHDMIFAAISHMPHVAAFAMVDAIDGMDGGEKALIYAASGFKDTTRIAGSHEDVWRDICLLNKDNILKTLDAYHEALWRLRDIIESGDADAMKREFGRIRQTRNRLG
jgi:prephenate dehydrogenase